MPIASHPPTVSSLLEDLGRPDLAAFTGEMTHGPCGRVLFGQGTSRQVGNLAAALGKRVLVVTDPGIAGAGHLDQVLGDLMKAGLEVGAFTRVSENPDDRVVEAVRAAAEAHRAEIFLGLGGGSSMDAAKGANFVLTNGGRIHDYKGKGRASKPMLPLIAMPTTAGTGSECQSYALISDSETHVKMACGDPKAAAVLAVLDPLLTVTQPSRVTRLTGIDALTHALESAVSTAAGEISRKYSTAAFLLLSRGFSHVCDAPTDLLGRSRMLAGAALAGVAIENSMLGAAHATANPLTAAYGVVHGAAVGVMMAPVLRLNAQAGQAAYQELAACLNASVADLPAWWLTQLEAAGLPSRLRDHDVAKDRLPELAEQATQQWTGTFNPVKLDLAGFLALYEEVW